MLRNYRSWFWLAVVFQLITGAIHSISLFVTPVPGNETERQLFELVSNYRFELGSGFTPTMGELTTALSSCFTLLCVFAGLANGYLLKKRADDVTRGILLINVVIFGVCFILMAAFTFPTPIVLTGLIFICLVLAYFFRRSELA